MLTALRSLYHPAPAIPPTPVAPTNVIAIRRTNYTVLYWSRPLKATDGSDITDVTRYDIYSSPNINGYGATLRTSVSTTDVNGKIDTLYIDLDPQPAIVYRVKAIAVIGLVMVESEYSDMAVAIQLPSQIDGKEELLDRKIMILDEGELDSSLLA